jgi:hypothetical protein
MIRERQERIEDGERKMRKAEKEGKDCGGEREQLYARSSSCSSSRFFSLPSHAIARADF